MENLISNLVIYYKSFFLIKLDLPHIFEKVKVMYKTFSFSLLSLGNLILLCISKKIFFQCIVFSILNQ